MNFDNESLLDEIDWKLIELLEDDARLTYRELGNLVSLSGPAVAKRIERLTAQGVIRGYHADIDLSKVGLSLTAFSQISVARAKSGEVAKQLVAMPEVAECFRISGEYSYLLKIHVASVKELEAFIDRVGKIGHSLTTIVLSETRQGPVKSLAQRQQKR
ncbi:MAG TPA: Lrp/AsnC family transcriptional regulator [Chroococcales cyanobacterium]